MFQYEHSFGIWDKIVAHSIVLKNINNQNSQIIPYLQNFGRSPDPPSLLVLLCTKTGIAPVQIENKKCKRKKKSRKIIGWLRSYITALCLEQWLYMFLEIVT